LRCTSSSLAHFSLAVIKNDENCPLCNKAIDAKAQTVVVSGKVGGGGREGNLALSLFGQAWHKECFDSTKTEKVVVSNVAEKNAENCVSGHGSCSIALIHHPLQPKCNKTIQAKDQTTVISGKTWHKATRTSLSLSYLVWVLGWCLSRSCRAHCSAGVPRLDRGAQGRS
jgi:hypothetical protein